jgi:hypothetical protein
MKGLVRRRGKYPQNLIELFLKLRFATKGKHYDVAHLHNWTAAKDTGFNIS